MIKFNDLKPAGDLARELEAASRRVLKSGCYIGGPEVESFEREWAEYCGARYCIGCASGLDALTLALTGCGIGLGDEVIVPAWGCAQTWLAVLNVGATLVPVWPWTPEQVSNAITRNTIGVVPVHLYGIPVYVPSVEDIEIIEDAAQAHGAIKRVSGTAAAFSFYPTKNLGAFGDAGAIVTNDKDLYRMITRMVNHSTRRLDPLQAAMLRVKLPYLDLDNLMRRKNAQRYLAGLQGVTLPGFPADAEPCWHQFVIRHPRRDDLRQYLAECGVETAIHYPIAPHRQVGALPATPGTYRVRSGQVLGLDFDLPIADGLARTVLSLPVGPHLKDSEVDYVIERVNEWTAK